MCYRKRVWRRRLADREKWLDGATCAARGTLRTHRQLDELVEAYSRMVSGDLEAVDVNALVDRVRIEMETKARESHVELHIMKQHNLPSAWAITSRLEQIVANLILNAIQQIDQQRDIMGKVVCEEAQAYGLSQPGQVIIKTRCIGSGASRSVQISVIDTGPGIHYLKQEEVFLLDVSTRYRGHGMGLFISRNLAETMGGRLRLAGSLLFIGSAFVVELPLAMDHRRQ